MRLTLLTVALLAGTSAAMAADLSAPVVVEEAAPVADWTGFYVGVIGGVASGDFDYTLSGFLPPAGEGADPFEGDIATIGVTGGGGLAGIQAGGDMQFDNFVLGVMGDISMTSIKAEISAEAETDIPIGPGIAEGDSISIRPELDWLATARARAGVLFENALFYVHGGAAWGHTEQTLEIDAEALPIGEVELADSDKLGYVVGVGAETMLTDSIGLKAEYAFYDLGRETLFEEEGEGGFGIDESLTFQAINVGATFKF